MYTKILVERNIADGRRLLEALRGAKIRFDAAFWFYSLENDRWRLAISSRIVDKLGPLKAYGEIDKVIESLQPPIGFSILDVVLQSSYSILIGIVRSRLAPKGVEPPVEEMVYVGRTANQDFIEDVYIYKI